MREDETKARDRIQAQIIRDVARGCLQSGSSPNGRPLATWRSVAFIGHPYPLPLTPCPLPLASSLPGKNKAEGEGAESAHRVTGSLECDGDVEASVDAECSEATVERMAVVCVVVAGLVRRLINA